MAVTRKSQHEMEITNAPSFITGAILSCILIIAGLYYVAGVLTTGIFSIRLLISLLLLWKGATFLLNAKMMSMRFNKATGKFEYGERSIRGAKRLEFAIRDITNVSVYTSKGWLPQDRNVEVGISVKDDFILYSTTVLSYPPKELAIGEFLGIKMDLYAGTLSGNASPYAVLKDAVATQQAGNPGGSADARKGKA